MPSGEHPTDIVEPVSASGRRLAASLDGGLFLVELPERGRLVVGRSGECDIVLDHASVSRKHVGLEITPDAVVVRDLGSANGTVVGGKRLGKDDAAELAPGAALELGTLVLTLHDAREANVEAPDEAPIALSPAMIEVHETIAVAARSTLSVLLLGETGVGKEVLARRVHELSPRHAGPLVRVNCAALVESLLEAELFGYERGAFTGALQAKPGLLEAASGGTLFLDEVGELPLSTQAKLLRVLESGEVTRVGALKPRAVDVRFVAATHRDLRALVASGSFREDLFFRLDGVAIRIPPLRERREEIGPLAKHFVDEASRAAAKPAPTLSADAIDRLERHPWTGNVRELRNVIQRSVLFCTGAELTARDLRFDALGAAATPSEAPPPIVDEPVSGLSPERLERRRRVIEALEQTVWNQTRAAEVLGVSRRTLQTWMIDLRVPRPRVR